MITDLDRLHKVISGEIVGRGCGTTFSKCHELAACVILKEYPRIVVVISDYRDIKYNLLSTIDKVFSDHDLKFSRSRDTQILCDGIKIDFMLSHKLHESLRGYPDHYEVDMTRPMMYIGNYKEHGDLARRIAEYAAQDKFILDDESASYTNNRETLKNYKW